MTKQSLSVCSIPCAIVVLVLPLYSFVFGASSKPAARSTSAQPSQEKQEGNLAALKKTLADVEAEKGADHRDLIPILTAIGLAYRKQGGYVLALPFCQRATQIAEKAGGGDSLELAAALDFLGTIYRLAGHEQSALEQYYRALPVVRKHLGTEHPAYGILLSNQASAEMAVGKTDEALKALREAARVVDDAYGQASQDATYVKEILGELYLRIGRFSAAEDELQYALTVRSEGLDGLYAGAIPKEETLYNIAPVENLLGRLYTVVGLYDKAEPHLHNALSAFETKLGNHHPALESVLVNLAALAEARSDAARAAEYQERARQIHARNVGFSFAPATLLATAIQAAPAESPRGLFVDSRVGDWVVRGDKKGRPMERQELVRKTALVAVLRHSWWQREEKQWSPGTERIVDLTATHADLFGETTSNPTTKRISIKGAKLTCVAAVAESDGKKCTRYFAPGEIVPLGGLVRIECDGDVLFQVIDYHRGK